MSAHAPTWKAALPSQHEVSAEELRAELHITSAGVLGTELWAYDYCDSTCMFPWLMDWPIHVMTRFADLPKAHSCEGWSAFLYWCRIQSCNWEMPCHFWTLKGHYESLSIFFLLTGTSWLMTMCHRLFRSLKVACSLLHLSSRKH